MEELKKLYTQYYGVQPTMVKPLTQAGSARRYYRIQAGGTSLVGVIGESIEENRAFIALSGHLADSGIPVPRVVAVSDDESRYLPTWATYHYTTHCRSVARVVFGMSRLTTYWLPQCAHWLAHRSMAIVDWTIRYATLHRVSTYAVLCTT